MQLLPETTAQRHIRRIEQFAEESKLATSAAITVLNSGHSYVWSLPDDELVEVLQMLADAGKLQLLLENHYAAATGLNAIQAIAINPGELAVEAKAFVGRPFVVSEEGVVSLVPDEPAPEPTPEPP